MFKKLCLNNVGIGEPGETSSAEEMTNAAIDLASQDIIQRQDVEGPRSVTLKITLTPQKDNSGEIAVLVKPECNTAFPKAKGLETVAVVQDGQVIMNEGDPQAGPGY